MDKHSSEQKAEGGYFVKGTPARSNSSTRNPLTQSPLEAQTRGAGDELEDTGMASTSGRGLE